MDIGIQILRCRQKNERQKIDRQKNNRQKIGRQKNNTVPIVSVDTAQIHIWDIWFQDGRESEQFFFGETMKSRC